MSDTIIRLAIVLGLFFGFIVMTGGAIYLAIAVFKAPLFVVVSAGFVSSLLVALFLDVVGKLSPVRAGRRYE